VAQASEALSRLASEIAALREQGESTARLAVARSLCSGADGGVLAALGAAASDSGAFPAPVRETAADLLSRLTEALGLSPIACRGELLALTAEELGEFDVRGVVPGLPGGGRVVYCVVRSGWWLGPFVVERPLVEPAGPVGRSDLSCPAAGGHSGPGG
jgi:hypothetical protein